MELSRMVLVVGADDFLAVRHVNVGEGRLMTLESRGHNTSCGELSPSDGVPGMKETNGRAGVDSNKCHTILVTKLKALLVRALPIFYQ